MDTFASQSRAFVSWWKLIRVAAANPRRPMKKTEEVGGFVRRAWHRGTHYRGGPPGGGGEGIIRRGHGGTPDTEPYKHELIYLTAKGPTFYALRRGA